MHNLGILNVLAILKESVPPMDTIRFEIKPEYFLLSVVLQSLTLWDEEF